MARVFYFILLLAFALTISSTNISAMTVDNVESIVTLDLCSQGLAMTPGHITALTEPSYNVPVIVVTDNLTLEEPSIYDFSFDFPIERPPKV